jgi:hypothetical protein
MSVGVGAGLPPASSTGCCGRIPVCRGSFMRWSSTGGGESEKPGSASTSDADSGSEPSSRMSGVSRETAPPSISTEASRPVAATARSSELSIGGVATTGSGNSSEAEVWTGGAGAGVRSGAGRWVTTRTVESGSVGQPMPCDDLGSPVLFSGHPRARLTNPLTSRVFRAGIPLQHVRPQYSPQSWGGPVHRRRVDECAKALPRAWSIRLPRHPVPPLRTTPSSPA